MLYSACMKKVLVVSTIKGVAGRRCLTGVFSYVNAGHDWSVRIVQDQDSIAPEILNAVLRDVDGIILSYDRLTPSFRKLLRSPVPIVQIHDPEASPGRRRRNFALIQNDDTRVGEMAAAYFRDKGAFRSYVYLPTENRTVWSDQHRDGFARELARRGLTPREPDDRTPIGDFLRKLPRPIAVFCATDQIAVNALSACRRLRLRVPNQAAILGVDDDSLLCEASRPTLSSVHTDDFELGRLAAGELDRLMRTKKPAPPVGRLVPPTGITERDSTKSIPPAGHLIELALQHIRADPSAGATDVARALRVSASLLRLRFRQTHGRSLRDEILDARLALTKRLLKETTMPIARVARKCGFASASHLSHFLKARTGRSPRDLRKTN